MIADAKVRSRNKTCHPERSEGPRSSYAGYVSEQKRGAVKGFILSEEAELTKLRLFQEISLAAPFDSAHQNALRSGCFAISLFLGAA